MKKFIVSIFLFILTTSTFAQKFKFQKITRDVNKEAKRYVKENWRPFAGSMPISQQLNNTFNKENDVDDKGVPKWLFAEGVSKGKTIAATDMQATELAKNNLVGLMASNIREVVETELSNNQISKEEAVSWTKTVSAVTNKVAKKLGQVFVPFKIYRENENTYEVMLRVAYNFSSARAIFLEEMRTELGEETKNLKLKNDKFLNPEIK
jgi:hypothetical protein